MSRPRKYPPELLERGVRMVEESGRPIAHVARDLGITSEVLRKRVRQVEADRGERPAMLSTGEREELRALRREAALTAFRLWDRADLRRGGGGDQHHYARRSRKPSARAVRDAGLIAEIHAAREGYRSVYGVRKTWKELGRRGVTEAGRERVARLVRQEGLSGLRRGKGRRTTIADETVAERARDLVRRDFTASRPNQLWVADLTYVRTWQGFCYLGFILGGVDRTGSKSKLRQPARWLVRGVWLS